MTDEQDRPAGTPPPGPTEAPSPAPAGLPPTDPTTPDPAAAAPEVAPIADEGTTTAAGAPEATMPAATEGTTPVTPAASAETTAPAGAIPPADAPAPPPANALPPAATPLPGPQVDPTADQPGASAASGGSRRRWALAIGVVALIAIGIAIVALLAGRGGVEAVAPRYLPATTVVYADVRFDLPGDQRQEVTELLARFPGFEDASTLEVKADDTFDRLVKAATKDVATYTADIKPWFGGQVAVGMTGLPNLGALVTGDGASGVQLPILGLISVKDATAAESTIDEYAAEAAAAGLRVDSADVDGHPTWTISDADATAADARAATITLTRDMLIVGMDPADVAESVKLGTDGGATLASSSAFKDATADLPDARLATLYLDGAGLKLASGALSTVPGLGAALQSAPVSVAGAVTVADGTITAVARTVHPTDAAPIVDTPATMAAQVPGTALAFVEVHDVGTALSGLLADAKSQPGIEALGLPLESIESLLGAKLEDVFAWVGDVAVVGWTSDGQPAGALVSQVRDQAAADERMRQVQAFLQLAGIGGSVTTTTTPYQGVTITSATLKQGDGSVTISIALKEGTFVLGLGEASVKAVLDVTPETSLASDPAYQATMAAAGPSTNAGSAYADLRGLREAGEALIPADQRGRFESEVKPWLMPFDQMGAVTYQDGSATVSQTIITTQQP